METTLKIVEETGESRQRILNLSHHDLKVVPPELSKLSFLHTLHLNNNLIIMPPEEISHLESLEHLSLEHNQLTLLPSVFSSLTDNLRYLNLSNNPFIYLPPVVCRLVNLRSLWLDHIGLTGFPSEVCCLASLEKLSLVGNSISEIGEEIGSLVNLRWLSLAQNRLSHLGHRDGGDCVHLTKLVKLEILGLQDNQLTKFPLELCSLRTLASINLRRNKILSLSSDAIYCILQSTMLVKLDLRENPCSLQPDKDLKPYNTPPDNPTIILT